MKTLKKLGLGVAVLVVFGLSIMSCSDDLYYSDPIPGNPIEASPEQPPIVDPR